jgi:hypothetical protein
MKKKILTLAIISFLILGMTKSTFAASTSAIVVTTLDNISVINKIEIHGNVEVYVSTGANDQVKVYNKYYAESALVQSKNGVLRISSYTDQKLVVWVTANNLRDITAYDNAQVQSFGTLSSIDLEVNLHNTASASLKMEAFMAHINVNDHAKVNLQGSADRCYLAYSHSSAVNSIAFSAGQLSKVETIENIKNTTSDLVIL